VADKDELAMEQTLEITGDKSGTHKSVFALGPSCISAYGCFPCAKDCFEENLLRANMEMVPECDMEAVCLRLLFHKGLRDEETTHV